MISTMNLISKRVSKYTKVEVIESLPHVCIVTATTSYIPMDEFKKTFEYIGELVATEGVTKLIFDKRNLKVFHQPSMEWYFVTWKEEVFYKGLTTHRKILPTDEIFIQSVRIGREKIEASFPDGKYKEMDIQYADTIEKAIEH